MCALRSIILTVLRESTDYEATHFVIVSIFLLLFLF